MKSGPQGETTNGVRSTEYTPQKFDSTVASGLAVSPAGRAQREKDKKAVMPFPEPTQLGGTYVTEYGVRSTYMLSEVCLVCAAYQATSHDTKSRRISSVALLPHPSNQG